MAINIPLITDYDGRGVKKAEKAFADLGKSTKNLGSKLKAVFLPAAVAVGALAAVSFKAVKAAVEDQAAQALLAKQLQNSTKATKADIAATEDFVTAMSLATGVADDELRPALASLVRVTRNTQKSQRLLKVALNVSKGTGKSLATVVQSISRAYGGNVKALAKLDPSLKQYITKTSTADQVTARLAKNFTGAAATAANTYAGRLDRMNIAFAEAKEALGVALLPILEKFVTFITDKIIPYIDKLIAKLEDEGLAGAFRMVGQDALAASDKANGFNGVILNLLGTAATFYAGFKIASLFLAAKETTDLLLVAVGRLGGVFSGVAATGFGVVTAAVGLLLLNIYVLIDALRDPIFRQDIGRFLSDSFKLVGNVFIFVVNTIIAGMNTIYNAFRTTVNKAIDAANLVNPFKDIPKLAASSFQYLPFFQYSEDGKPSGSGSTPPSFRIHQAEQMSAVTINVNGGDPQATVDAITRWYRQNGATVAWMR